MTTLRDWIVTILGEPIFYKIYENPNYSGTGQHYSTVTVQYDWAFIAGALAFIVCLIGFITLLRMAFGHHRR